MQQKKKLKDFFIFVVIQNKKAIRKEFYKA